MKTLEKILVSLIIILDVTYMTAEARVGIISIAIRMQDSTIGCIQFDDENVITECCIYDDVISKSRCFSEDINERLKRFVGQTLKFQEE